MKEIAQALRDTLISPNVADSNLEPANIVDVISQLGIDISRALGKFGNNDAATPMGALEAHGKAILDASENIAEAIRDLAEAIRYHRDGD